MDRISDWLGSCSFEDALFQEADQLCKQYIAPYFRQQKPDTLEELITTTLKLYKEVIYIRDTILGDQLNVNYVSRKEFAENVMFAWRDSLHECKSIVPAICYELNWE